MATLEEFRLKIEAARRFTHEAHGATWTLRLPVEQSWRRTVDQNRDAFNNVMPLLAARALVDLSLVDWQGVTQKHLDDTADPTPIPFNEANRALLLDWRADIADTLSTALAEKRRQWKLQFEEDSKNSPPASNGT